MENEEKRECPCNNDINNRTKNKKCLQNEMLMKIRELSFSVVELGLYLDTHPKDPKALLLHKKYTKELKDLKDKYQRIYGPLSIYCPCNKWRWIEEPWPWEKGENFSVDLQ